MKEKTVEIESLKARVYLLMGQLEEAKIIYGTALKELDELNKKQNQPTEPTKAPEGN